MAALTATTPSSGAVAFLSTPLNEPMGVRAAETMKTSLICVCHVGMRRKRGSVQPGFACVGHRA